MGKKRRHEAEAAHAELLSRELAWLEASSRHRTEIVFGAPVRCPSVGCGDFGIVESVTPGRQHNRCWSCGLTWSLSRKAMALFAQACREQPSGSEIVGAGTLVADLEPPSAARTTRERLAEVRNALHREPPAPGITYLPNS